MVMDFEIWLGGVFRIMEIWREVWWVGGVINKGRGEVIYEGVGGVIYEGVEEVIYEGVGEVIYEGVEGGGVYNFLCFGYL